MIAHFILAHAHPNQLSRLVNKLSYPNTVFFIHIDLKSNQEDFEIVLNKMDHVYFIKKRIDIQWATYSMVEATINGFKEIVDSGLNIDFVNLLSAQDYPIKSAASFHAYLQQNSGKAFMHCLDVETEWKEAILRVREYHFNHWNFPGKYRFQKLVNFLLPHRRMPDGLIPVGRSQWFTISLKHVVFLIKRVESAPKIVNFFRFTWAPDELIFQTLLYNSAFKEDIISNNLRYIDWSQGLKNPKLLTSLDFNEFMQSDKFFARKFNENDPVLDMIDQSIS